MAKKTNGDDTESEEIILEATEMREQLGIVALEAQVEDLKGIMAELLLYMNTIERMALQYSGEPVLKKEITASHTNNGLELTGKRPMISDLADIGNLVPQAKAKVTGAAGITINNA